MPIRGELSLRGELLLRELRQEAEAEQLAVRLAADDDVPKPRSLDQCTRHNQDAPKEVLRNA